MTLKQKIIRLKNQPGLLESEMKLLASQGYSAKLCLDAALNKYQKDLETVILYNSRYTIVSAHKVIRSGNEIIDVFIQLDLQAPKYDRLWNAYIISSVPDRLSDTEQYFSSSLVRQFEQSSLEALLGDLDDFLKENDLSAGV